VDKFANDQVKVTLDDRATGVIAFVMIDNPSRLNSMNSALMREFVETFTALSRDEQLRAVVLTGAGSRAFIGGANIHEMAAIQSPVDARPFIERVQACCHVVRSIPVPVIARIQGYAFGAGLEIAASCDLRIASDNSVFGMPEVRLGIPSVVEAALLPMLIGWGRTRQLLLLGGTIDAGEAQSWNLVEKVVAPTKLDEAVEEWLSQLLASGPCAIRLQKELIRSWEDLPIRAAVQAGIETFVRAFETKEPAETMRSFFESKAARKVGDGSSL
jgi:enoyl-CoA hydratase/carnithine racemase